MPRSTTFWILPLGVFGRRVHHFEPFRQVVPRQMAFAQECHQFGQGQAGAFPQHREGAGPLAQPWVGHRHHGDLLDPRMLVDQAFHLHDGHVLAAADDDVLGAPGDAHVAVAVDAREVAGVEPAVRVGGEPFRVLEVADEVAGAPGLQAAFGVGGQHGAGVVHHADLHAVQRAAVGLEGLVGRIADPRGGDRAVFGHAPGGDDVGAQVFRRAAHQRARDRCAGGQEGAQALQVLRPLRRLVRHVRQERGRRHGEGDALGRDQVHRLARVPDVLEHHFAAQVDVRHVAVQEAGLVRQRRCHQDRIVLPQAEAGDSRA